jgi:hypothetical protein
LFGRKEKKTAIPMTIRLLVLGKALRLKEVFEMPCLGEVLTIDDLDFVVSNISLGAEVIGAHVIPHLNLLPVGQLDGE